MSPTISDRNLLFGILALQVNFLTRDALVKGMNAWVLEKHRPLGRSSSSKALCTRTCTTCWK